MNRAIIEINQLTKKFKKTLAVNNLNFSIEKSKIIGLLGPNGCGKSTTIGMLLGLIKPTSGSVIINGKNIENNRTSLLEKMNFISPYIELPKRLSVEENLVVYGRLYGVKKLKDNSEGLNDLGLWKDISIYDPFRDGNGGKRIGNFVRDLLNNINSGIDLDISIRNSVENYTRTNFN